MGVLAYTWAIEKIDAAFSMYSRYVTRALPLVVLSLISVLSLILWRGGDQAIAVHTGDHVERDLARLERTLRLQAADQKAVMDAVAGLVVATSAGNDVQPDGTILPPLLQSWTSFLRPLMTSHRDKSLQALRYYSWGQSEEPDTTPVGQAESSRLSAQPLFSIPAQDGSRTSPTHEAQGDDAAAERAAIKRGVVTAISHNHTVLEPLKTSAEPSGLYLLVRPVYRTDRGLDTAQQRWTALQGVVVGQFDMAGLMSLSLGEGIPDVGVVLADLGPLQDSQSLVHHPDARPVQGGRPDPAYTGGTATLVWSSEPHGEAFLGNETATEFSLFQRHMRLAFRVGPSAYHQEPAHDDNTFRALAGLLIAFLLAGLMWMLTRQREQADQTSTTLNTALTVAEQGYKQLFRTRKAVELIIEPATGRILDANDAAVRFYGWRYETLCRMDLSEIVVRTPDQQPLSTDVADVEGHPHQEDRHRLASGHVRDVEVYCGVLRGLRLYKGGAGQAKAQDAIQADVDSVVFIYATIHDISERKQAEQALAESEAQFRVLFENSPLAIQIIDRGGRTVRVNQAWEDMWGRSSASIIHSRQSLFDDPQMASSPMGDGLRRALNGMLVEIGPFAYHLSGVGKQTIWVRAFAYPLMRSSMGQISPSVHKVPDPDETTALAVSEPQGGTGGPSDIDQVIIIFDNVGETLEQQQRLQRALETLRRSNEELEQFAYVASHDLQEPLRMVTSYLTLLRKRLGDNLRGENGEFLDFAVEGARRMQDLIRDLLDYARTGQMVENSQAIDSRRAVDQAQAELAEPIAQTHATLTHGALPSVAVDASELTRLFTNIIGNALKYRSPDRDPQIHVDCERQGNQYRFSIHDNGIGIEEQYHERIFLIFQRLHSVGQASGTGIGLAICRKIVEHNGGEIGVTSDVGKGSTFWFTLPVPGADSQPVVFDSHSLPVDGEHPDD